MKNKCKCGKEISWGVKCYKCETKEDRMMALIGISVVIIFFGLIFGAKLLWANIVFDDWRCALSECRFIK